MYIQGRKLSIGDDSHKQRAVSNSIEIQFMRGTWPNEDCTEIFIIRFSKTRDIIVRDCLQMAMQDRSGTVSIGSINDIFTIPEDFVLKLSPNWRLRLS
jgi:hypothetical protein